MEVVDKDLTHTFRYISLPVSGIIKQTEPLSCVIFQDPSG
jgi:hypothetical protein